MAVRKARVSAAAVVVERRSTRRRKAPANDDGGGDAEGEPPQTPAPPTTKGVRRGARAAPMTPRRVADDAGPPPASALKSPSRLKDAFAAVSPALGKAVNAIHDGVRGSPSIARLATGTSDGNGGQTTLLGIIVIALVALVCASCGAALGIRLGPPSRAGTPGGVDGLADLRRRVGRLEGTVDDIRARVTRLASASLVADLQEGHRDLAEQQAATESRLRREIERAKAAGHRHSFDSVKVEVARALATREDYAADYALYAGNGRVVGHSPLFPRRGDPWFLPSKDGDWYVFSLPYDDRVVPGWLARAMRRVMPVHPKASVWLLSTPPQGHEVPGHCLPLRGSTGYVDIRLRARVVIHSVALEHIPMNSAYNISTAPREVAVFAGGRPSDGETEEGVGTGKGEGEGKGGEGEGGVLLGTFAYDVEGPPSQTFQVRAKDPTDVVRLEVRSNHGSPDYTCVYRLRVFGDEEEAS